MKVGSLGVPCCSYPHTHLGLRVEWLKCRARAHRAREEVRLVEEEMCRVLGFCKWKESWWRERVAKRSVFCSWLGERDRQDTTHT